VEFVFVLVKACFAQDFTFMLGYAFPAKILVTGKAYRNSLSIRMQETMDIFYGIRRGHEAAYIE
jgi:hypothetical protein